MSMIKRLIISLVAGYSILIAAVAANGVALTLKMTTWYALFQGQSVSLLDGLFLFMVYPILLGGAAMVGVGAGRRLVLAVGSSQDNGHLN